MGQVRHSCATTTRAVRAALQRSKARLEELAAQHGLFPRQWRNGASAPSRDAAMGALDRAHGRGGGGRGGRLPQAYAVIAGAMPLYPSGHDPAPDAVLAAPAPATRRDPPAPGGQRRQARQARQAAL